MPTLGEWAQFYQKNFGWSIIPVGNDKKPLIKWKEYRSRVATQDEIIEWWAEHPEANIAVVCGAVSGISVIDIDSYKGVDTVEYVMAIFWDSVKESYDDPAPWMDCVKAFTPRGGEHWFFQYNPDLVSRQAMPNVDIKSDGGYVLISPSVNKDGPYKWLRAPFITQAEKRIGLTGNVYGMTEFPEVYHSLWSKSSPFSPTAEMTNALPEIPKESVTPGEKPLETQEKPECHTGTNPRTNRVVSFEEGGRDESLFHVANTLILGGMPLANVEITIGQLAESCDPPFKDGAAKVLSALERGEDRLRPLAQEIRQWVEEVEGVFTSQQVDSELRIRTKQDKGNRRQILNRMKDEGIIEQFQVAGKYRKITRELATIDFRTAEATTRYSTLRFPLGEEQLFLPMEKNIIIVAGTPDAGKTAWLLDFVRINQELFDMHYFSSEMGGLEFKSRLQNFPTIQLEDWKFKAYEKESDFHDSIRPNSVNVIDFLEMHENFYLVGQKIKQIWDKLDKGICVIALQKNPNNENPLGGTRAKEKARLVLNLDHQKGGMTRATITKGKNWRTPQNPRGMYKEFWITGGCQFTGPDPQWMNDEDIDDA